MEFFSRKPIIKCHISVNSYKREWQESLSDFIKKNKTRVWKRPYPRF